MTKDEWLKVEQALSSPFGHIKLVVDGYDLTLEVRRLTALKYVILPFVNGWAKGEWLRDKTEEARRFYRPVKRRLYSPAQVKKMTKGLSKSAVKRYFPGLDKVIEHYTFEWPSFAPLKRHLIANNTVIELKECA